MGKYDSLIDEEVGAKPAPTTPQEANYGALIDEELSSAPLHNSLFGTAGTNPDEEAKKRKLAKELNTPAAILPNDAEQQVQLKKLDADVIKTTAPASAKFLTNEDNAKVTGLKGVDKLVEMERAYKTYNPANIKKYIENYTSTGKPAAEAVQRLSEMKKQGIDLTKELDPFARSTADYFKDPIKAAAGGANIMAAGVVELSRLAPNPVSALMSALSPAYAEARRQEFDTVQQQLNDNVEYWQGRKSPAMQKLIDDFGKAGITDSVMMLIANPSLAVDQLSQSTPYMLPGAAAARGGAGAMATFSAFTEAADAANTARQEAIANGQTREQQDRSAMIAAVTTAPLAFLGNKLTGTAAFEADFFTKGSTGQKLLGAVVKEAISGSVEEGANQLGVNVGAVQYDDNRQILEGVGKAAVIGGLLESTHAVGMTAAERALNTFIKDTENVTKLVAETNSNAAQAVAAHDTIEELSAMTADNELRTRAPEAFQEFIETMTEGEELQEVYVDGATALEAIKNNYTDLIRTQPELFARIQEAAGLGHDVQFTVGEYLTYFAGNPIEKTVLPMLKSEPGGATYQEAQEFYNKQAELFQSEVQAVAAQNEPVLSREEFEAMRAPDSAYNGDLDEGLTRIFTNEEFTGDPVELTGVGFTQDEITALEQVGQATNGTMSREQYGAWLGERSNRLKPMANRTGTYEEYVAQHNNKREVYAKDVETVEATIFNEMQKAGRFTSSVNRAYVAPLVEYYKTQAKNFGVMPSEMYAKYPLKVQAFLGLLPSGTELNQTESATLDDFRPGNVANVLDKGNWVIMSPENPKAEYTPDRNPELVKKFEEQLKADGIEYYPVDGKYGNEEKSFILFNTTPEQGLALGRQYDQDSVLVKDGLIYQDGSRNPSLGKVTEHSAAPPDYYTTVVFPDGTQNLFTVEVDFDTKLQAGEMRPLTPEMVGSLDQTKTEAFKKWFGDSKVVDENGEPLVVYRGASASQDMSVAPFIFLSTSKEFASTFADREDGVVIPAYVKSENPFDYLDEVQVDGLIASLSEVEINHLEGQYSIEPEWGESLKDRILNGSDNWDILEDPVVWDKLKRSHDGIFITEGGYRNIAVFNPTQIKSAIGNIGTFDPANPSIVNQGAAKVGQVSIRGVHYSKEQRATLNGGYYGTGIKGAEGERVRGAKDSRIKQRLYFYVDEGKGVFPEYGVGNFKHVVDLPNMYDGARNPLKLPTRNADGERDMNVFESAVIDAGFDGYYIESAFGRQGAAVLLGDASRSVKPLTEAVMNQSIYYSQLTRSVAALKQNKGTVEQWKGIIKNLPGVKVDEIEAVGINEWLDLQTGSVTKEDIIGYLDANGVQVEEVVLGELTNNFQIVENEDGEFDVVDMLRVDDDGKPWVLFTGSSRSEAFDYLDTIPVPADRSTKYTTYVVGGENAGENYREILLTLPANEITEDEYITLHRKKFPNAIGDVSDELLRKYYQEGIGLEDENGRLQGKGRTPATYKSTHFDQRNILAHVRVDERVGPNGERVLFVNEVQSDWAQDGKKKGFKKAALTPVQILDDENNTSWLVGDTRIDYWKKEDDPWYNKYTTKGAMGESVSVYSFKSAIEAATAHEIKTPKIGEIPNGPFVSKTDAWVALALKRIMRYAADQGMDQVAIVNGQQAADLYDLSKQVDELEVVRHADDTFTIHANLPRGGRHLVGDKVTADKLPDLVGKDLAKTISEQHVGGDVYDGDQLKVGGEGMKTFYDQIVPKVAKDVLKKLGAQPELVSVVDEEPDADKYRIVLPNGKVVHTTNYRESAEANLMFFEGARIEEYTPDVMVQNGFTLTPDLKAKIQSGLPLFQGTRGSFNLDTLTMTLMQGADLSTVIHESGHFYLEMLEKLANTADAPQQVQDDYAKTMEWFGLTSAQWAQMSLEQKRPYHEQWAESFERWNLEGQAPTQGLQPIFSRFRAWLLSVYKSVEEFVRMNPAAGKLNDEVRGVFSRLLASAEAIEATEQARAYQPLFSSAEQAGVSQNAYEDYVNLGKQATQDAIDVLQARSMRDMKWLTNARNKALKDLQATAKAARAKVLTEVTEQVTNEPIYQAMRFLRTGETKAPNGDTIKAMQGYKLDKAIIAEMFPESALDRPDLTKLRGMTSDQGLDPDVVARMFGLPSGDALVREIVTAENMRDKIQGLTDQRMLEEHGDLVDDKSLQRAADEAVHNEARAKFMATGIKMLSNSPISVTQMVKAAKQAAENVIANKRVRDVKPRQYTAAESRANKEVLKLAAKNPAQAAEKQRAALLNNRLAAAAQDAVTEVEKALRYLGKFNNEGTRKNLDIDYLEQIDALLEPFDLRKGLSLSTIDARATLAEWVQNQEAMGFEPTIDPVAMAEARQKSYKNMTMTELRGLVDTIKQIEHMGRMKKKLLTAIDKAEFAERIAEAKASMALNTNRVVPEKGTPSDVTGQLGQWVRQMFASHRKFTSFMRELDGGQNNGVLFNLLVRPMAAAGNTETEMKAQAAERLATLFQPIMKTMSTFGNLYARRRLVPGTNISLTHEQRIMFAMNWGNEGNRQRLLDGGITGKKAMSEAEAQAVLDTLTKEEWDFVQGVWDYIAEYRPLIAEQERMLTGKTPEWVEPAEVVTKFGTYKGGYFPAKYDTVLSTRSDALEAVADLRSAMKGAFGSAAARNGYTKARAAQVVGRPLLLNFNAVSRHVNEVIHRLAWQAWLVDAARVSRALDDDFRTYLGAEATKEIQDAIRDIAQGDAPATGPFEVFLNRIRTGTSIVGMGWKITTAMLQPTGLSQSIARVGGRHMAKALARYVASPLDSSDWVNENSVLMRNRGRTMNREMNEILNTVREGKKTSAITASFFYLVGKLQRTVDIPTFIGAYEKSLEDQQYESAASEAERKRIEATAIAVAEQTVIDTQGGGELKDLAKVQRGSPIYKLFTNFYSYMSTVYNLNVENYRTKNLLNPSELGIFAAESLLINFVPVVMAVALKNLVKGSCDWDDMECLAERYTSEQISHLFGQMVGLREIGVSVDALTGGEAFGYTGPAGLRFFVDVYKSAEQINQGEADMALFKAVNNTLGALFHYPAGQINATVDGAIAIENGEVEGAAILPALIAGAPK